MAKRPEDDLREAHEALGRDVGAKEARKLKARRERYRGVWFGLGMFGVVGWSVALPVLAMLALGIWIDSRWPSRFSWTLMLLFVGIVLGCLNAWRWISRERETIEREERGNGRE
jgi:ATP synthase protein I